MSTAEENAYELHCPEKDKDSEAVASSPTAGSRPVAETSLITAADANIHPSNVGIYSIAAGTASPGSIAKRRRNHTSPSRFKGSGARRGRAVMSSNESNAIHAGTVRSQSSRASSRAPLKTSAKRSNLFRSRWRWLSESPGRSNISRRRKLDHSTRPADRRPRKPPTSQGSRASAMMSPSVVSFLSQLTSGTGSSSGSNTTVTQRSYAGSSSSRSPRSDRRRVISDDHQPPKAKRKRSSPRISFAEPIDVFKFLQDDPADSLPYKYSYTDSVSSQRDYEESSTAMRPSVAMPTIAPQPSFDSTDGFPSPGHHAWIYQDQLHSDSGVSMQSSSPESMCKSPVVYQKPFVEGATQENDFAEKLGESQIQNDHSVSFQHTPGASSDEESLVTSNSSEVRDEFPVQQRRYGKKKQDEQLARPSDGPSIAALGNLSTPPSSPRSSVEGLPVPVKREPTQDDAVTPLYRRFDSLNHRVLMHLQDELAELEKQLKALDDNISKSAALENNALQISEWSYHRHYLSQLSYQRSELLGRIFMKKGQHYEALKWLKSVTEEFPRPEEREVQRYRDWLRSQNPDSADSSREYEGDLLKIADGRSRVPALNSVSTIRLAIFGPPVAFLFTVIAFAATSTHLGRVVWLSITVGASLAALHHADLGVPLGAFERCLFAFLYTSVVAITAAGLW